MTPASPRRLVFLCPVVVVLAAYLPDLGRGFIKDDFRWIRQSQVRQVRDVLEIFERDNGFYRPVVSLSFAINELAFGLWPAGYALTNLLLLLACGGALFALARALGMETAGAGFAAALWLLNPHGINSTVLWISGRTALLLTLFALLAALAAVKRRPVAAACATLLAVLSKEEAVLLPVVLAVWSGFAPGEASIGWDRRRALRRAWPLLLPMLIYFPLRARTQAYLPTTAPGYYRFTLDPSLLVRNLIEYADRSGTLTAAVVLLLGVAARGLPRPDPREARWMLMGLAWLVGGFGLTVFVPVRSSLYACFPSVGAALVGAALAQSLWWRLAPALRSKMLVAAALLPIVLLPVLRSRNVRMVKTAELSARATAELRRTLLEAPEDSVLVLTDDPRARPNLRDAWGSLIEDAVFLETGRTLRVLYEPSMGDWTTARIVPASDGGPTLGLTLQGERLVRSDTP